MKKIVVLVPHGAQIAEDKWVIRKASRVFNETNTIKDVLDFVHAYHDGDLSSCNISEIKD